MSDMIRRFRGHILLFIMLTITAGLSNAYAVEEIIIFNREYYAVKDLNASDIWKLKDLMFSNDAGAAKNAGVILGRHYVRQGDVEKGYKLLKDNLDDSYFDRFMKINAHLWVYDAANKVNDKEIVKAEENYLTKLTMDEKAEKAFRLYCTQERLSIDDEDVKTCIDRKPEKKPETVSDLTPVIKETAKTAESAAAVVPAAAAPVIAMTPRVTEKTEETKPEPVKEQPVKPVGMKGRVVVNVVNSFQNPEIIEGMLYTISRQKINIELDFKGDKGFYDYVIDAGAGTISSGGVTYDFSYGRKENMRKAAEIAVQQGAKVIVLGYAEGNRDTASEIADSLKQKAQFLLFNIQEKDFQGRLKEFKSRAGGQPLSYVICGTQEQVIKILPFMKYYSPRPEKTVVVNAVDAVSRKYFMGEYGDFSKNTIVVSDLIIPENQAAESFAADFAKDFNKAAVISDFIGYDFIQFIEKRRNSAYGGEYLSNIKENEDGIRRISEAYRILGGGKLQKLEN